MLGSRDENGMIYFVLVELATGRFISPLGCPVDPNHSDKLGRIPQRAGPLPPSNDFTRAHRPSGCEFFPVVDARTANFNSEIQVYGEPIFGFAEECVLRVFPVRKKTRDEMKMEKVN